MPLVHIDRPEVGLSFSPTGRHEETFLPLPQQCLRPPLLHGRLLASDCSDAIGSIPCVRLSLNEILNPHRVASVAAPSGNGPQSTARTAANVSTVRTSIRFGA